jgi:uncharacterized protein YdaU (DUF1376 family)
MTLDPLPLTAALWYTRTVSLSPAARGPYLDLCLWLWANGTAIAGDELSLSRVTRQSRAGWRRVADEILPLLTTTDGGESYTDSFVDALRKNPSKQRAGRASAQARRGPAVRTDHYARPVENAVQIPTKPADIPGYPVENLGRPDLRTPVLQDPDLPEDLDPEPLPIARARGGAALGRTGNQRNDLQAASDIAYGVLIRAPQGRLGFDDFRAAVWSDATQKYPGDAGEQLAALCCSPTAWQQWPWLTYDQPRKRFSIDVTRR